MKINKIILGLAALLAIAGSAQAQSTWNWGDEVDKAKENNVIYTDAYKAKDYQGALEPLNWLLTNTPDLNPSIYINGAKIYQALAKAETDAAKKEEYIQTGLGLHDTRIKYYPDEKANVMDRKAIYAYGFYSKDRSKYPYLYDLYNSAFELKGVNMNSGNLVAYMNIVYKHRNAGGDVSDEKVIETYSAISDALQAQKDRVDGAKKAKYDKFMSQVDKILTATGVQISCEFVETKLGPKLEESGDLTMAKKIFGLMLKGKCLKSPLALKAAGIIQENEPTYGVAKFMAQKNAADGKNEEAIASYKEAAGLTDDNTEKAEAYVAIAKIQSRAGQKSTARNSARRALSFSPSHSDAYKLIGDLYMGSFDDCKQEKNIVEDRAIFIAAYQEYKKAGYNKGMASAEEQFPSITEIFSSEMQEGQSITIGCWVNQTVTLKRRSGDSN